MINTAFNPNSNLNTGSVEDRLAHMSSDEFNEYNDWDATACANGDYNTWEENQIAGEEC